MISSVAQLYVASVPASMHQLLVVLGSSPRQQPVASQSRGGWHAGTVVITQQVTSVAAIAWQPLPTSDNQPHVLY